MSAYSNLVASLKAMTTVSFCEYEWTTRPAGDFGVVNIDFESSALSSDSLKAEAAMAGSVDLYLHKPDQTKVDAVQSLLTAHCGASWRRNSIQYESSTRLLHIEWVFELEAD